MNKLNLYWAVQDDGSKLFKKVMEYIHSIETELLIGYCFPPKTYLIEGVGRFPVEGNTNIIWFNCKFFEDKIINKVPEYCTMFTVEKFNNIIQYL